MQESIEHRSRASIWNDIPKPVSRFLESNFFKQRVGDVQLKTAVLDLSEPLTKELLEIDRLIQQKEIAFDDSSLYLDTIPRTEMSHIKRMNLVGEMTRNTEVPKTYTSIVKALSPLYAAFLETQRQVFFDGKATTNQQTLAQGIYNELFLLLNAYIETQYLRSTRAQIESGSIKEGNVVNTFRMQELLWRKLSPMRWPSLSATADFIDNADGSFVSTLKAIEQYQLPATHGADVYLRNVQNAVQEGIPKQPLFTHIQTATGILQCEILSDTAISDINGRIGEKPRLLGHVRICALPPSATGYYSETKARGIILIVEGVQGHLTIPFTMFSRLDSLIKSDSALSLRESCLTLLSEAISGEYVIGKPVPLDMEVKTPPDAAKEDLIESVTQKTLETRIPRDMSGEELISIIRRLNRAFLKDKVTDEERLEAEAEPRLRQKGSHATVFCAETNRIAPVPMNSTDLPIGTLKNILRLLHVEVKTIVDSR
jgi:predicted RNA binding protein YcfA (HicA-like mRNA interferase family)